MTNFTIRTLNSLLGTTTETGSLAAAEDALALGLKAAIAMATDEVLNGATSSAVVVTVEDADARPILRHVVSLSTAPVLAHEQAPLN